MSMNQNVPGWERGARVAVGVAALAGGVLWALQGDLWAGVLTAVAGVGLGLTGMVGWCPLCAAVGRTLPRVDRTVPVAKL